MEAERSDRSKAMTMRAVPPDADPGDLLAGLGSLPSAATVHVYDHVYRLLRQALITREIKPGARLVEADLATHLQVSRTPVRDALRRLEADGLVRRSSKGGLQAASLSADNMDGIFRVRTELDQLAARLAADRASAPVWTGLRGQVEALGPLVEQFGISSYQFGEAHEAFHMAIYSLAFTPFVANMLGDRLLGFGRIASQLSYAEDRADEPVVQQHLQLLDALASDDHEAAAKAAAEHVRQAWADARDSLEGRPAPAANPRHPSP